MPRPGCSAWEGFGDAAFAKIAEYHALNDAAPPEPLMTADEIADPDDVSFHGAVNGDIKQTGVDRRRLDADNSGTAVGVIGPNWQLPADPGTRGNSHIL